MAKELKVEQRHRDAARNFFGDWPRVSIPEYLRPALAETFARFDAEKDARIAELELALTKIDAIRNSIVGFQTINWSEHIYPLVAALNEAGFEGEGYEIARENAGTLLEQIKAAEKRIAELERERDEARELARLGKDRRIEIALKTLAARFPVILEMTTEGQTAIINAMEDFAQALSIGSSARTKEILSELIDTEAARLLAEQRLADAVEALRAVRRDIVEGNARAIIDTVWHSDIETTVDFIDAFLATLEPKP